MVGHEAKHDSAFNHVNLSFVWQSVCWTSGFPKSSLEPSTFNQQTFQNITLEPKFWILSLFSARLPSGKIGGFRTRARQMATRCFCPPDKRPPRGPTCVSQPCAWQWLGLLKKRYFDQQYFGHIYQGCFCTPFISLVKTSVAKSSWCQDCQHEAHWKCHFLRSKMGNEIAKSKKSEEDRPGACTWENKTETAPGCLVVVNKIQIGHLLAILQVLRRSSLSFFESIQNLTEKVKNTHPITCSSQWHCPTAKAEMHLDSSREHCPRHLHRKESALGRQSQLASATTCRLSWRNGSNGSNPLIGTN